MLYFDREVNSSQSPKMISTLESGWHTSSFNVLVYVEELKRVSQPRGPRGYDRRMCEVFTEGMRGCNEAIREPCEYPYETESEKLEIRAIH